MDLRTFRELLRPHGRRALAEAERLLAAGTDPVAVITALRRTWSPEITSAALTQATLRDRARAKFGADAAVIYFTADGLEQATRPEVAAHRARRIAALSPDPPVLLDVCCGIGGDLIAFARAGHPVDAVDSDPLTVEIARANAATLGLPAPVEVRVADAAEVDPSGYGLLFADPGRRGAGGRTFDPMAYSPAWPVVLDLAHRAKAACIKAAPGIPYEFIPEHAEAEWVSYRGDVKEAAIWIGTGTRGRRATLLPSGATIIATGARAEVGPVGRFLYEPDGAVIRAHLIGEVAELVDGRLIDPRIAYLTGDRAVRTEWAAGYEVTDVLPFSVKRLRAALRERGIGTVTIKKRGSAVDVERLRKELRLSGDGSAVIVLTRIGDRPYVLLCRPLDQGR